MPSGHRRYDALILLIFALLAIGFFWQVTVGGMTMLPADNLYAFAPWKSLADEMGVAQPHNGLLSDLILENYGWKQFIIESIENRQLPLWNPRIMTGVPFFSAGQHSAIYPFSVLFYVVPLTAAYGWFAALHLFLAGTFVYLLSRTLRVSQAGSAVAGLVFEFSGFVVTRNVFPMIIAGAVWLPLILCFIERICARMIARPEAKAERGMLLDVAGGGLATAMLLLAGHPEIYYYSMLVAGAYAVWRLVQLIAARKSVGRLIRALLALGAVAAIGGALGAAQWLPLFGLVQDSSRAGAGSLQDVLSWAYPPRRVLSMLMPDFFGNPTHHTYLDLFTLSWLPVSENATGGRIDTIYWGIKNYVEGASYVGLLPLVLALIGMVRGGGRRRWFFALLALGSLALVFGTPLYTVIYHLPGLSQVRSPFRWIYPYTLCAAVLAGMGVDALVEVRDAVRQASRWRRFTAFAAIKLVPALVLLGGLGGILGLAAVYALRERLASVMQMLLREWALADTAFADWRMMLSYEFRNVAILAAAALVAGLVLTLGRRFGRTGWWAAALGLAVVSELWVLGIGFFSAVDPALVAPSTPGIEWLQADDDLYRVISYEGPGETTLIANAGMYYGIDDVRGYDSIILKRYVDLMNVLQYQGQLPYNRIGPIDTSHVAALDSHVLDLLNCKYVLTDPSREIDRPGYRLVYDGEMRIYENLDALPRAFLVADATEITDPKDLRRILRTNDPLQTVPLDAPSPLPIRDDIPESFSHDVVAIDHTPNRVTIGVDTPIPAMLVLTDAYTDDWEATVRPADGGDVAPLTIYRAYGHFRAVLVPKGQNVVEFVYRPQTVTSGLRISGLAAAIWLVVLAIGLARQKPVRAIRGGARPPEP